jgi:hypothetical protein
MAYPFLEPNDLTSSALTSPQFPYSLPKKADLETQIADEENKAKLTGLKIPSTTPPLRIWDILEWARYPITNMLYTAAKEYKEEKLGWDDIGKILKSALYGITLKERHNTEDVLRVLWPDKPEWIYKVGGIAGDILTDPTTYLTFGWKGGAKGGMEAGKVAEKWAQESVKKAVEEGAEQAFAKGLIAKFGGRTYQEAIDIGRRLMMQEVGEYGLRLGLPFAQGGALISKGGRLAHVAGVAKALGAGEEVVKGIQAMPTILKQLMPVRMLRRAFDPAATWGLFPEIRDIERDAVRMASWRSEIVRGNLRNVVDDLDNVLKSPTEAVTRAIQKIKETEPDFSDAEALLEAMWRRQEYAARSRKAVATATLPPEVQGIDSKLREILDDLHEGMVHRGLMKEKQYIKSYFPRYYIDSQGGVSVVTARKYTTDAPFFKTRQIDTRAQAAAMGFRLADPLTSLQIYVDKTIRVAANYDMAKEIVEKYGKKIPAQAGKQVMAEGMVRAQIAGLTDWVLPREIGDTLNITNKILTNPDELQLAGQFLNRVQNWWKRQATIYNVGFHARNAASNAWTGLYKDGFGPRQLANQGKALDIFFWKQHPQKLIEIVEDGKKVRKTAEELYDAMRKAGVHTGGFMMPEMLTKAVGRQAGILEKAGSATGSFVENSARISSALNDLDKGFTLAQAAKRVNHYFLDYSDLTKFETKIRKLIPFYSWLKKNLMVQVQEILNNPGKYSAFTTKPLRALNFLKPEEAQYLPDWMRQEAYINPLGIRTPSGAPLMLNPNLPFQDIGKIGIDILHPLRETGPIGSLVNILKEGVTPFAKVPIETALNRSAFTGAPLEYTQFDYRPAPPAMRILIGFFPEPVKQKLGIIRDEQGNWILPGKWVNALNSLIPLLKIGGPAEQMIQTMTGAGIPEYRAERAPWEMLGRTAGIKFRPFDVGYYKQRALQERLRQLKGLRSLTE